MKTKNKFKFIWREGLDNPNTVRRNKKDITYMLKNDRIDCFVSPTMHGTTFYFILMMLNRTYVICLATDSLVNSMVLATAASVIKAENTAIKVINQLKLAL